MLADVCVEKKRIKVDKGLLEKRFQSAIPTYNSHAIVQQAMATRLMNLARSYVPSKLSEVLEIGCGTGLLTQEIVKHFTVGKYNFNDLVDNTYTTISPILDNKVVQSQFIGGDAEQVDLPGGQSCIWSGATIQWISHLDTFFKKLNDLLDPEGYLVVSTFGPDNYQEIRQITGNGIDYKTKEQIIGAASPQFELLDFDEWQQSMWFNQPLDVLKHMRYTGVNSVSHCRWGKGQMHAFISAYEELVQLEGYPLTYHPYLMIFKRK